VLHAVTDGQRHLVALARRDHRLAFAGMHRHRLFAPDVLAGRRRAQRQRRMQMGRRDDVHHVDVVVVGDPVEVLVVVDVAVGDTVLGLPLRNLRGRAGDDAGQPANLPSDRRDESMQQLDLATRCHRALRRQR